MKLKVSKRAIFIIIIGVVLGLLACGGLFIYANFFVDKDFVEAVPKKFVKKPREYELKLFMVGDALIHQAVYYDAMQSDGSYDFKPMMWSDMFFCLANNSWRSFYRIFTLS